MKIGYGKLARSWNINPDNPSIVGGDIDAARLLMRLAKERPQDEFWLMGRCQGGDPQQYGYPKNVRSPWVEFEWDLPAIDVEETRDDQNMYYVARDKFRELVAASGLKMDQLVLWVGQVANSSSPLPPSGEDWGPTTRLTYPLVMSANYSGYLLYYINDVADYNGSEPILLVPDPRNYWKPRELTRPLKHPILAQYEMVRPCLHEQFQKWGMPWQEGRTRMGSQIEATVNYEYAGVELTALDDPEKIYCSREWDRPHSIGIISNENANTCPEEVRRGDQIRKYILERWPDAPIYGKWTKPTMDYLGRQIEPVPYRDMYDTMRSFRMSMTFPASGSGWATAKAWEAFAVGTVMFFHKGYDEQGWIVPRKGKDWKELRKFLIVHNQRQLWERAKELEVNSGLWRGIVDMQRQLFETRFVEWRGGAKRVMERLDARQAELE
jgi:hypothetical protein